MEGMHTALWFHCRNKNVSSDCQKRFYDTFGCLRSVGRLFQTRGPAALKALSPTLVRVRQTRSVWLMFACFNETSNDLSQNLSLPPQMRTPEIGASTIMRRAVV